MSKLTGRGVKELPQDSDWRLPELTSNIAGKVNTNPINLSIKRVSVGLNQEMERQVLELLETETVNYTEKKTPIYELTDKQLHERSGCSHVYDPVEKMYTVKYFYNQEKLKKLETNEYVAKKRAEMLLRKVSTKPEIADKINAAISDNLSNKVWIPVNDNDFPGLKKHFLPWNYVMSGEKIRLVTDSSAQVEMVCHSTVARDLLPNTSAIGWRRSSRVAPPPS